MKCAYCLKEIGDQYSECPFCGFPVSVPFTVENVKQKWKQDMALKQFKVEPSLNAMHRAEGIEAKNAPAQERTQNRGPQRGPSQNNRPQQNRQNSPRQQMGNQQQQGYPQGFHQQGHPQPQVHQQGFPQQSQWPGQYVSPTQQSQYPNQQNQSQQGWGIQPPTEQKPKEQSRGFDAELFNDWLN